MTVQKTEPDAHGRHWVTVTRAEASSHPKGRPGPFEVLIAIWLMAFGALDLVGRFYGGIIGFGVIWPILFILTSVGLILRLPIAWVISFLCCIRVLWAFVFGGYGFEGPLGLFFLGNAVVAVAAAFYMLEGERPNLIYRLRYRSYRAEAEVADK